MNDALLLIGLAAVVIGVWLVSPPAALIVGGLIVVSFTLLKAVVEGMKEARQERRGGAS